MQTLSLVCAFFLIIASAALLILQLGRDKAAKRLEEGTAFAMLARNDSRRIRWSAYVGFVGGLVLLVLWLLRD